jgi:hypothetical protein
VFKINKNWKTYTTISTADVSVFHHYAKKQGQRGQHLDYAFGADK